MTTLEVLKNLPVGDKIQLVEDLWDSISMDPDVTALTELQKKELDRRLERQRVAPQEIRDWQQVKMELRDTSL